MNLLITGGAGYIGSVLVRMALEQDHKVTVVDRLFFGRETLPEEDKNLKIIKEDIRSVSKEIFKGIDGVIDLAAISNDPAGELDPTKTWSINHLGRLRIAVLAKNMGVKRYLLPSSCSAYGFQDDVVDETSDINPLTTYAKANVKAEEDIIDLADNNFCVTIIRQATVYGLSKRMRFDLAINGMTKGFFQNRKIPILKDGKQWRPMVHVKDTARAQLMILEAPIDKVNKQLFNVGSNEQNYQIFPMAEMVAKAAGIPFEYEWYGQPDHRSYKVDFNKIKTVLGFKPEYDAEKGAKEIWDALKNKGTDPDDPRTITLNQYKKLLADGVEI
ncbi:SDR family oxidoreductase [Candidatus Woesearchaeota archaeon]|nr:SDR family oxidoreductase [Candidatus Woesearchaeota archaeon]